MPRVALLCPDLMFGSRLESALAAGGHEVQRVATADAAREAASGADLLVVDLTVEETGGPALVESLGGSVRTLGFYSHVEQDVRRRAEAAGFDRVVPRSRMAREAAGLVDSLVAA